MASATLISAHTNAHYAPGKPYVAFVSAYRLDNGDVLWTVRDETGKSASMTMSPFDYDSFVAGLGSRHVG